MKIKTNNLTQNIKLIFLFGFFIVCFASDSFSQGVVTLLQGRISEKGTNKPLEANIKFKSLGGKIITAKSNYSDGAYQLVLKPGETYVLTFKDYFPIDRSTVISIPDSKSYSEVTMNFVVETVHQNMELYRFSGFEPNSYNIIDNAKPNFQALKTFLEFNPKVNVKITVSSIDSKVKYSTPKRDKKDKKVKKEKISDIAKARMDAIRSYFEQMNMPTAHMMFEEVRKPLEVTKGKEKARINVLVTVCKILDI
jgi:hypothetical protein